MRQQIFRRLITPLFLACAGIAATIHGVWFHSVQVINEKEIEETKQIPVKPTPTNLLASDLHSSSAWGDDSSSGEGAPGKATVSQSEPAFVVQKIKRIADVPKMEFEPSLLRELTVGGVTFHAGELRRTYQGDTPALCPT
ncbi:MAG: hypothetical protein WCJ35_17630 [Planctomycetota bacterium]